VILNPHRFSSDPHWANVVLLLHFDGTDGSTTYTDSSSYARTVTSTGLCELTNSVVKYGSTSGLLPHNGHFTTASTAELVMGTADFTAEVWAYLLAYPSPGLVAPFFGQEDGSATGGRWHLSANEAGLLQWYFEGSAVTSGGTVPLNQWVKISGSRASGTTRVFMDGVQQFTFADSNNYSAAIAFRMGGSTSGCDAHDAYYEELRVTKGVGRYTAGYTPSGPFPNG